MNIKSFRMAFDWLAAGDYGTGCTNEPTKQSHTGTESHQLPAASETKSKCESAVL